MGWTVRDSIPANYNKLILQSVQTNCLAHTAVYPVGTVSFAHGVETA